MSVALRGARSVRLRLAALVRDQAAVTALEFGLIGILFIICAFAIFDNALALFAQSVLDNATRDGAREVRLGILSSANTVPDAMATSTNLIQAICNGTTANGSVGGSLFISNCTSSLTVKVTAGQVAFSQLKPATLTGSGLSSKTTGIFLACPGDDTIIQVAYQRPALFPSFVGSGFGQLLGTTYLLSTAAFQNEAYSDKCP